jgi:hypothetical protein
MPSIRDLKGRPVDEEVDSRVVAPPGQPPLGEQLAEREAIRAAVEKVQAMRGRDRERDPEPEMHEAVPRPLTFTRQGDRPTELPADMEAGLAAMELTLVTIEANVRTLREQMAAVRARAEKDSTKLVRLAELLKQIGE